MTFVKKLRNYIIKQKKTKCLVNSFRKIKRNPLRKKKPDTFQMNYIDLSSCFDLLQFLDKSHKLIIIHEIEGLVSQKLSLESN